MADDPQRSHPLYDSPPPPDRDENGQPLVRRILVYAGGIQRPYLTYALLIINVGLFALRFVNTEIAALVINRGVADPERILNNGEFYRLLTSMFLHLDVTHIMFNGIALYQIGSTVERVYGHLRYGLLYLLGGLAGSVLATLIGGGGLGASGAVFAIFGALALHYWQHRDIYGEQGRSQVRSAVVLIVLNFAIGFFANAVATVADSNVRISNSGHLGGLLGGLLLAWWIGPRLRVTKQAQGYLLGPDGERTDTPALQLTLEDSNPLSWRWIGLYAVGLVGLLALGVLLT